MGQTEIYQHFNREDHEFIDRCIELSERVVERYSVEVTGFLNPHQVTILRNVAASYQLQVFASSDEQKMEYAKVIVAPDYYQLDPSDFDLCGLLRSSPTLQRNTLAGWLACPCSWKQWLRLRLGR